MAGVAAVGAGGACCWVVLLTLAALLTPGAAIECFMCSYSPRSNLTGRVDECTDDNFNETKTETSTCTLGCESVSVFDVNGAMESFHRNCATNDTLMTNTCETYETVAVTRHVCSCDWSYCNLVSGGLCAACSRGLLLLGLLLSGLLRV